MEEAFWDSEFEDEMVQYGDDDIEIKSREEAFGDEEELAELTRHTIESSILVE